MVFICLSGCAQLPAPPGFELSREYQGRLGETNSYGESLQLYLTQDVNDVEGEYYFDFQTGIDSIYGKLEGRLEEDRLKLSLKVPPHFIREYGMSATMDVTLTGTACSQKEAEERLKVLTKSKEISIPEPQLLTGRVIFTAFGEKVDKPIILLNQPTPDNAFNK